MKKIVLIGALALLPAAAFAGDPTVQELTTLHDQVAILTQQLAVAKLQSSIAQAGGDTSSVPTPTPTGVPGLSTIAPASPPPTTNLPSIISIVGSGATLTATLQTSTGTSIVTAPGQMLPGGMLVKTISADGVTVLDGPNVLTLPFAGGTSSQASVPASAATAMPVNAGSMHGPSLAPLPLPALPGSQGTTAP